MSRFNRFPMFLASLTLVFAACLSSDSNTAQAQGFGNFGFQPFGFYQPFGAQFSSTIRTPPYFATNPPVYYGARHARPYGISPFASPPVVAGGPGYRSRLSSGFVAPPTSSPILGNPCVHTRADRPSDQQVVTKGAVQLNPFMDGTDGMDRLAKR